MSGNGWITDYIESRVERGKEWRSRLDVHRDIAKNARYVRILGRGFRAISIDNVNPCGQLRDGNGKEIPFRPELERALQDAMLPSNMSMQPGANRSEHQLQASLIRAALQNDLRFGDIMPGLQDGFDDLIFVTDEFAIKPENEETECRADVLALGRYRNSQTYSPVFIELKNDRLLTRLKQQLDNAERLLCQTEPVRRPFKEFLSAVSGVDLELIDCSTGMSKKVVIWPKSPSGQEASSVTEARRDGFLFVEFGPGYSSSLSHQ